MMRLALLITMMPLGCADVDSPSQPSEVVPLLDPVALAPVASEADALVDHRPALVECPPAAWGPEGGGFEIQTGVCNYAAFSQPLGTSVEPGDELAITVWHDRLDAAEPATAHVGVWFGSAVVWETEVEIPGPSNSFEVVVPIEARQGDDARLGLHLHNHGFNTWRFLNVDLVPR